MTHNPPTMFRILSVAELERLPDPQWLVETLIAQRALGLIYGPSGAGKSFFALDMLLSIAMGTECFGLPTRQGPVVYVAGEGRGGIKKRVQAWRTSRKLPGIPDAFFVLDAIDLANRSQVEALIEKMEEVR
jgi:hypothetical protein